MIRNTIGKNCKKNMKNAICNLKQYSEHAEKYEKYAKCEIQIPHAEYALHILHSIFCMWDLDPIFCAYAKCVMSYVTICKMCNVICNKT